jgi:hypothetical protein
MRCAPTDVQRARAKQVLPIRDNIAEVEREVTWLRLQNGELQATAAELKVRSSFFFFLLHVWQLPLSAAFVLSCLSSLECSSFSSPAGRSQ